MAGNDPSCGKDRCCRDISKKSTQLCAPGPDNVPCHLALTAAPPLNRNHRTRALMARCHNLHTSGVCSNELPVAKPKTPLKGTRPDAGPPPDMPVTIGQS